MDSGIGNQQQIPVQINQPVFHTIFRTYRHPPGNGQRPVQPSGQNGTSVALRTQSVINAGQIAVFLQLESRPIGMAGAHHKSPGGSLRNPESHQRSTAPGNIVLSSCLQLPGILLRQPDVPLLFQSVRNALLCMINTVGLIQVPAQIFDSFVHGCILLSKYVSLSPFYTPPPPSSTGFPFFTRCRILSKNFSFLYKAQKFVTFRRAILWKSPCKILHFMLFFICRTWHWVMARGEFS